MEKTIKIDGMGCEHCIKSVKETLESLKDVKVIEVTIGTAKVFIPEEYDFSLIKNALDDAGYEVI